VVRYLLSKGAQRDTPDAFGKRPVDHAREGRHTQVEALLTR
jgi:hypothetical protein